jgi:hypothetical protein
LVVPYGDQVMLAQALQKTFPNVFFFFFFDIKYQHFKNKIFSPARSNIFRPDPPDWTRIHNFNFSCCRLFGSHHIIVADVAATV